MVVELTQLDTANTFPSNNAHTGSIVATVVFGPRALTDPDTPDQRKTEGARNHATLSGYAAPVRSGRQGSLLTLDTLSSRNAGGCLGGLEETLRYLGQQSSGNSNINTSSKGRGGVGLQAGSSFLGMRDQKPSVWFPRASKSWRRWGQSRSC